MGATFAFVMVNVLIFQTPVPRQTVQPYCAGPDQTALKKQAEHLLF